MVLLFKNIGERSTGKNYHPASLLSVISKVFEKLVNNRIVYHLEKCDLFSDFQYGFRSSRSTADLVTVVSDRIARTFNQSFFLTSSMVLALLNQLQIFAQLYLIELLGFLTSLGLLVVRVNAVALEISKIFDRV